MTAYINAQSMKTMAIVIISFDLILLVGWLGGAIYTITQLSTDACFDGLFIVHFLVLIHFALGMCIANIVDNILSEEKRREHYIYRGTRSYPYSRKPPYPPPKLLKLPYHFFSPLAWIFTSIISFFGDVMLLSYVSRTYLLSGTDTCNNIRIAHIVFDSTATFISVLSIIWFIIVSFYVIEEERKVKRITPLVKTRRSSSMASPQTDLIHFRSAFMEWYKSDRNKPIIYCFSLIVWTFIFTIILTILPQTANSTNRATFYIPLSFFIPLLFFSTLWLNSASFNYYTLNTIIPTNIDNNNNHISSTINNEYEDHH